MSKVSTSIDRAAVLRMESRRPRGLTLVEILAVVVLLGLIAGTLAVGFSGSFGKAKHELAKTGIGQVIQKLEVYRIEKQVWPTNEVGLKVLSDGYADASMSYYLEPHQLRDPWKRPYLYVSPGPDRRPYEVLTLGADGERGGEGEDADVSSANLAGDRTAAEAP